MQTSGSSSSIVDFCSNSSKNCDSSSETCGSLLDIDDQDHDQDQDQDNRYAISNMQNRLDASFFSFKKLPQGWLTYSFITFFGTHLFNLFHFIQKMYIEFQKKRGCCNTDNKLFCKNQYLYFGLWEITLPLIILAIDSNLVPPSSLSSLTKRCPGDEVEIADVSD